MFDARGGDRENFGCVQYELILGSTCGVGAVGRWVRGPGRWWSEVGEAWSDVGDRGGVGCSY